MDLKLLKFIIGYILLTFVPTRAIIMILLSELVMGFFHPINSTVVQTFVQKNVAHDKLGRFTSISNTLSLLMIPIGAWLTGLLADILGVRFLFFLSAIGGLVVIVSLYMFTGIRHIDFDKDLKEERGNLQDNWFSLKLKENVDSIEGFIPKSIDHAKKNGIKNPWEAEIFNSLGFAPIAVEMGKIL